MNSLLNAMAVSAPVMPNFEFCELAPLLLVFTAAMLCVLVEAFVPRSFRFNTQMVITCLVILAAIGFTGFNWADGKIQKAAVGSLALDGPAYFAWFALLIFGLLTALMFGERRANGGVSAFTSMGSAAPDSKMEREAEAIGREHSEIYPLMLFSLTGMMLMVAASDLLMMFVALEVFSLPLYLLVGLARRRRLLSQEAAIKYFLLGALSSALFLFGVALVYGFAGSFDFNIIDAAISLKLQNVTLLFAGMTLLGVGLLFKIGAVPFHSWMPDVYTGAPTPVTAFMAICTKLAAVFALSRLFFVAFGAMRWHWQLVFAIIAAATMILGAVMTVTQTNVKRLLGWSSVTHAGFILAGVAAALTTVNGLGDGQVGSIASISFYLAAYGLATLGFFSLMQLLRRNGNESHQLKSWAGIGRTHPLFGVAVSVMMLSFAGIPLTAGFVGKLEVFLTAWRSGLGWLVLVALLASIIAAFAYFRVIVTMFFKAGEDGSDLVSASPALLTVAVVGVVGTILAGVLPDLLTRFAIDASMFIR